MFVVRLTASEMQVARLAKLQHAFAALCNDLAPTVSDRQCWNRVALHHLVYREMRERHPEMGSQMVCNAIYAVCKVSRLVYQHPASPYHVKKLLGQKLPVLRFAEDCPVYFDSHTLTLTGQRLSMYTMEGRIKFDLQLSADQRDMLARRRLVEITLKQDVEGLFMLSFYFDKAAVADGVVDVVSDAVGAGLEGAEPNMLPGYVGVEEGA